MTTIISKRSKASHVSSILKTTSIQNRLNATRTAVKVRFQLPYSQKVHSILENYVKKQQVQDYENLVVMIRDAELFDEDFKVLLDEATQCVSVLNYDLRLFVEALLSIDWSTRGTAVVTQYQSFLLNLLCAHNYHAKFAIDKLVQQFLAADSEPVWNDGVPTEKDCTKFTNIHFVINTLLEIIPMTQALLINSLDNHFPYLKKSPHVHEVYVHNLLCILDYKPKLRPEIFRLLFSKLIILDVNSPREEIQQADMDDEEVFQMDDGNDNPNKMKHSVAYALDLSLDKVMNYFVMESYNIETAELIWEKAKDLYQDMLNIFNHIILPTYNTHHTQFVMFALCSMKPALAEGFLNYLWKKVVSPEVAPVLRMSAVMYIASLISRASYIPLTMLKGTLQQMAEWIHSYIANQDGNEYINGDIRVHSVFYSVCQGLFYVIAFRQNDLVSTRKNISFLESLNLGKMVTSKLNPLRVCQPAVVQNFASVTRTYQLAYCYPVIEHNSRNVLPTVYQDEKGCFVSHNNVLDAFFPFDPYVLKSSGQKIIPFYLNYKKPEKHAEPTTNGHSSRKHQPEIEDDDFLPMDISSSAPSKEFDALFMYGTSPGFKHKT